MAGNLYQLKTRAPVGAPVIVNGPFDRFGVVLSLRPDGYRLIRGTGETAPSTTAYTVEAARV